MKRQTCCRCHKSTMDWLHVLRQDWVDNVHPAHPAVSVGA